MVTVIHADGNALLLTHYCMIGNQPQMKATPKPGDKKIAFEFVRATNMKSDKDMHMQRDVHLRGQGHAPDGMDELQRGQGSGQGRV